MAAVVYFYNIGMSTKQRIQIMVSSCFYTLRGVLDSVWRSDSSARGPTLHIHGRLSHQRANTFFRFILPAQGLTLIQNNSARLDLSQQVVLYF